MFFLSSLGTGLARKKKQKSLASVLGVIREGGERVRVALREREREREREIFSNTNNFLSRGVVSDTAPGSDAVKVAGACGAHLGRDSLPPPRCAAASREPRCLPTPRKYPFVTSRFRILLLDFPEPTRRDRLRDAGVWPVPDVRKLVVSRERKKGKLR